MNVESIFLRCVTLKCKRGSLLNQISHDSIRSVLLSTAETVSNDEELFERATKEFRDMQIVHPQYGTLAARMLMFQLHNDTPNTFEETMLDLWLSNKLSEDTWIIFTKNNSEIKKLLMQHVDADFEHFTYHGIIHLMKSYLLKNSKGRVVERPTYMMMRIALGLNPCSFEAARETFELLIDGTLSFASPIMFNAGTTAPYLASCFVQTVDGVDVESKYNKLKETALISAMNGVGVGMNIVGSDTDKFHIVVDRAMKDVPRGTEHNNNAKRPDAAVYREPWETDFLQILRNKRAGEEDETLKDLFLGMWTPDLFVERLLKMANSSSTTTTTGGAAAARNKKTPKEKVMWSFFDGKEAQKLRQLHGREFEAEYLSLETRKKYKFQMPIAEVFAEICDTYRETGVPYTLFKDVINRRSNHSNRGIIKGSNLSGEILEYTDVDETAVCTLASICVSKFLVSSSLADDERPRIKYDYEELGKAVRVAVRNLNNTIDLESYYPSDEAKKSHRRMRPIGIGMEDFQGLLLKAGLAFTSGPAKQLLDGISSQIYFSALDESRQLAIEKGKKYRHFEGSMYSRGVLQQDTTPLLPNNYGCSFCWFGNFECDFCKMEVNLPDLDWRSLSNDIVKDGLRNSLVTAVMPTVSTSQIFGHYESADPLDSLVFIAKEKNGGGGHCHQVVCEQLVEDLNKLGLWTPHVFTAIVNNGGSLEGMMDIPKRLRDIYKTVWDIKQMERMKMAAIMGKYIDQGHSFSVNLKNPTNSKYLTLLLFAHECDLKTANYYHRSKPAQMPKKKRRNRKR